MVHQLKVSNLIPLYYQSSHKISKRSLAKCFAQSLTERTALNLHPPHCNTGDWLQDSPVSGPDSTTNSIARHGKGCPLL